MTQNKKIAVTGGIGSGKSTLLGMLKKLGYPVFSCDGIYAELCADGEFLRELGERFPGCVKDGALDRRALSQAVFPDKKALARLNDFTHPRIMERLLARMQGYPLSFAEVPLLFEGGYAELFDGVIVLLREKAARVEAVKARSGLSEAEILARMERQFDYAHLPDGCMILDNNGPTEALETHLRELLKRL